MREKTKLRPWLICFMISGFILFACTISSAITPQKTPQPSRVATAGICSADNILVSLRNSALLKTAYEEYAVDYSLTDGILFLNIWLVDPDLGSAAAVEDVQTNNNIAILHASYAAIVFNASESCIASVFDKINVIVVDQNYNGWLSTAVPIASLPVTLQPTTEEMTAVIQAFEPVYLRRESPPEQGSRPRGSCTWTESNARIHLHFDPARANVNFYFVGDENSRKVTAQWDGALNTTLDIGVIYASIMNVAQEIQCLYPAPDYLYIFVLDNGGGLLFFARLPSSGIQSMDLNELEILYQVTLQN